MPRDFDGSGDRVTLTVGSNILGMAYGTVACWIRVDPAGTFSAGPACVLGLFAGGGTTFSTWIEYTSASVARFGLWMDATSSLITWPNATTNTWRFVVFSKGTGTVATKMWMYDYGTQTWEVSNASGPTAANSSRTINLASIGRNDGDATSLDAEVAGVFQWKNRALTDDEVKTLHVGGVGAALALGCTGAWVLDQSATTINVRDLVGNSHQSALTGTAVGPTSSPMPYGDDIILPTGLGADAGGPSNQVLGAQVATLILTGVAGTPSGGTVPKTAQVADLTLTGVSGSITVGNATKTAQVATLTLTGVAGSLAGGPGVKVAQIAELFFTGIPGSGTIVGGGGEPTLLTVGLVSGTTVALSWTGPTGGGLVSLYNIETSPDNSVWTFNATSVGAATNGVAIGLTILTTYYFRVQAVFTASGPGPWSAAVLATTTSWVVPGAPLSLTVGTVTDTSIQVSWLPPTPGLLPILRYWGSYDGGGDDSGYFLLGDLVLTATATGLQAGTIYTIGVWAENADAFGPTAFLTQTTTGVQSKTSQDCILLLTAIAGTLIIGTAIKTAPAGALTLTALPGVLTLGAAPQTKVAQIGALTLTPVAGTKVAGTVTRTAQPGALALSTVQGTLTGGAVTKTAQVAAMTLTALPGGRITIVGRAAQIAILTLTAQPGTTIVSGFVHQAQIGLLTLTADPGRLGVPFVASANNYTTSLVAQRVEIRVNDCNGQWAVFVRAPALSSVGVEWPGYYVRHTSTGLDWYRAGVLVESVVLAPFTMTAGTIELECRHNDLCILRVQGLEVARRDFSEAPLAVDDDHQGFASYDNTVITDAEGGGMPVVAPVVVTEEGREPLPVGGTPDRRPMSTSTSSGRRPL
jgi:hypothetical protein